MIQDDPKTVSMGSNRTEQPERNTHDEPEDPTWRDVFAFVGADGEELSQTQLATALCAHPAVSYSGGSKQAEAHDRIERAPPNVLVPRKISMASGGDSIAGYRVGDDADV